MNKWQLNLRTRNVEVGREVGICPKGTRSRSWARDGAKKWRNIRSHEIPGKHESERAKVG